jgi:glucarate dehydratase
VSLALLLGGAVRTSVALAEYFSFRLPGHVDPGESTPLEIARYCARMIEEHGAVVFEGKVATVDLATEVEMVREVRAAIGDRLLRLDANGAWTVPTAREALRRLEPYGVHYYEDPVETYEEMARLRSVTAASFSTHAIDLAAAVRLGAPDTIVTNLNDLGGIARTVAFIEACARLDVGFRFHSGETAVGTAAYLQVSAAMEHVREPSQTLVRWYADDVIAEGTPLPKGGEVAVPEGPGLGITLDPVALRRCHERYLREGAFPGGGGTGYGASFRRT